MTLGAICPQYIRAEISSYQEESITLYSGTKNGSMAENFTVGFSDEIVIKGASCIKAYFSDYALGSESYIEIISMEDGNRQTLDANSLRVWKNASGYFNGDSIKIALHVAPGESGIYFKIDEILVSKPLALVKSICGTDDRVSSNDNRIGRIEPHGCTGWLTSNGSYLTAGHCTIGDGTQMDVIEFNVPASDPDGTTNHPPPDDQYPIDPSTIVEGTDELGNDWAIFSVFPNPNTGLLPVQAHGGFFRLAKNTLPLQVRVTGYGMDDGLSNYTQQTDAGDLLDETIVNVSNVTLEYLVDTRSGNSGSPIADDVLGTAIGIHTNGGCYAPDGSGNYGTGFKNESLENAIQSAPGANVKYVDFTSGDLQDGTIFRPYGTVSQAVSATVGVNAIVSIIQGSYETNIIIEKPLTLIAPVGIVTIGN